MHQKNANTPLPIPQNQLLLYISDETPHKDWLYLASCYNWDVLHQRDLLSALGAFIMLMPGIVVVNRRSVVGSEAMSHIEDVLPTTPQSRLILIELGVRDGMARYGVVVRLGAAANASPVCILARMAQLEESI